MHKRYLILPLIALLFSCEKVFVGDEEVNTPENNFQLFWDDFDQHYALFGVRNLDWDSIYTAHRPQVNGTTSQEDLFGIFKEMVAYLDDGHTFIYDTPRREFFASGSEMDSIVELEFSLPLIESAYLDEVDSLPLVDNYPLFHHGKIAGKDIGYVHMAGVETDDEQEMDLVLDKISQHKAIILDLRNNGGGDDPAAAIFAGHFADAERLIYTVQEKSGPAHDEFETPKSYSTQPGGRNRFTQPVIVLTDRVTISAAEVFLLHLKSFPNVTQLGDTTAGDFSDTSMRRFLPNGVQYQYSIMKFLLPDGSSLDGLGHVPDVQVRNTTTEIQAGQDRVLETAIQYLFDTYGID